MRIGVRATAGPSAIILMLVLSACDGSEDAIGRFEWGELPAAPVTEYSSAEPFGAEIAFIGEFNAPSACFRVSPQYQQSGSTGTLRIRAVLASQQNCEQSVTAFRYQGLLRGQAGLTELRVRHEVEGEEPSEFVHDLTAG